MVWFGVDEFGLVWLIFVWNTTLMKILIHLDETQLFYTWMEDNQHEKNNININDRLGKAQAQLSS